MAATTDLGNDIGYVYVVDQDGATIKQAYLNESSNIRAFLDNANSSRNVGTGQLGSGNIQITSIDAAGGTLSQIRIGADNQMNASVVYPGGTTIAGLAVLIAAEINASTSGGTYDYRAVSYDDVVYFIPNLDVPDSTVNKSAFVITDGSGTVYVSTDVDNAVESGNIYGTWGDRYYINADVTATATSVVGATEITDLIVLNDSTGVNPVQNQTIASGGIVPDKEAKIQTIQVDTEAAAGTDDLDVIVGTNFAPGDRITLIGKNAGRIVTVKNGVNNINLTNSTDWVSSDKAGVLELYYSGGQWYELSRGEHTVSTDATITGIGTSGSPLVVATPFPGFTSLALFFAITTASSVASINLSI